MKIIAILLSFYMLSLSGIPCGNRLECTDSLSKVMLENPSQDGHRHSVEICSPFCTCSCCGMRGFNMPDVTCLQSIHYLSDKLLSHLITFFPDGYTASIWQPPRLA